MLINLRNALMAGKRLPYDAEVEYLQSSGTQYIDTGFIPSSNTSVEIGYKTADAQLNTVLFGCRVTYSDRSFCVWANANGKIRFDYSANSMDNKDGPNPIVGSWVQIAKRKERNFVNGTEYTANATNTFACNGNAYLFAMNDNGTANWLISAQISYCKIWDNNVLVRDYIPVRKGTVGYLYDRVSGKLFGNAGTGDFVLGPDVVPVEWLQGDGSAYIVLPQSITSSKTTALSIECKYIADVSANNKCVFASYYGSRWYAIGRIQNNAAPVIIARFGNTGQYMRTTDLNGVYTTKIIPSQDKVIENGVEYSETFTAGLNQAVDAIGLFCAYNTNDKSIMAVNSSRLYWFNVLSVDGGSIVKNLISVRVGTAATSWEGAMMDVLTRRIYRNAGTGAFTYGNDLKYPIPAS